MGRGDEVDIVRALILKLPHYFTKARGAYFLAAGAVRNGAILAIYTPEGASREEHRARAARARDYRLLPLMKRRSCQSKSVGTFAISECTRAVNAAFSHT